MKSIKVNKLTKEAVEALNGAKESENAGLNMLKILIEKMR